MKRKIGLIFWMCAFCISSAAAAGLTLASGGHARAEIVLDGSSPAAKEAAEDLQKYLRRITGAEFSIVHGTAGKGAQIVIGNGKLAAQAGIHPGKDPESFVIRTVGQKLYIAGADTTDRDRGTAYGVSDFLERDLGVRWLWPGELGTVIPQRRDLTIAAIDRTDKPAIHMRNIRDGIKNMNPGKMGRGLKALEMDPALLKTMQASSTDWNEHLRVGTMTQARTGHAFHGWYKDLFPTHPEYFAMMPDGSRKWPFNSPDRVKMCVSNPAVAQEWMRRAREFVKQNPGYIAVESTSNDNVYQGPCTCAACEAWDDPGGEKYQMEWYANGEHVTRPHVSLTDRYVHFYNILADMFAKEFPDRYVGALAYGSWLNPPLRERTLHPNILLGFVGYASYTADADREKDLREWEEWSSLVKQMIYRPNILHQGFGMPMIYVHKLAADMKFRADHRLIGVDFDSLVHHWSSQGLNYYVLAKLLWNPHLDVDALIADYCKAGYGPAAESMRRYYAMIETRTDGAAHDYTAKKRGTDRDKYQYWKAIPEMFPDEVLTAWRNQLRTAAKQVPGDSVYAKRIRWVELGLDYADIERRLFTLTSRKDLSAQEKKKVAAIYAEKQSWYKAHLGDWSIYGPLLRWRENGALFGNSSRASDVE